MAVQIPKFPHKLEDLLGRPGTDEFVDFLNQAFHSSKEDVVQTVGDRFERRLVEETSKLRIELKEDIAGIRTEMIGLRAEFKENIADLKAELKEDLSAVKTVNAGLQTELKGDISGLRSEMKSDNAVLHRDIAVQTRWILAVFLAAAVLYPILNQLVLTFVR